MTKSKPEVVVITGASAGIGRATVRAFARQGAYIGLVARSLDGLEGARREVEEAGGKALVLPTDVADHAQVEAAAAAVEAAFGPIDIWINVAMASILSPFKDVTPEDYKRSTEVTYLGQVYGTMAALRRMLPRDRGTIVQVGSALAYRSIPLQSVYCGAKAAIRGFTDSLRSELIHDGSNIRLTMVQLPGLNTPQFGWIKSTMPHKAQPVPPIFQPEVAADAIYWAAHSNRREVYVGGSTVEAILGTKIAPGILDRYLAKTAYSGQQTEEPRDPNRPNNLWEPVPGDHGAHGSFDDRATSQSLQLWATKNQDWLILSGVGVAGLVLASVLASSKEKSSAQQAQSQPQTPKRDSDSRRAEPTLLGEMINQFTQSSKKDKFQILMGLTIQGLKALSSQSKATSDQPLEAVVERIT